MASSISNITELFHRFHICEMSLKQGKIAACLIAFKEVIEKIPAIPKTDREKGELRQGIETFLKALSGHKKFKEIFGDVFFGDTDLETNLEFIKSMIIAQEQDIVERYQKDEEAVEIQRLEIARTEATKKEEIQQKIKEAVKLIDEEKISQAMVEIINTSEDVRDGVIDHYNTQGMKDRETKQFDEAVKNYSKAISVSPEDENLHYNMARAYFEAEKRDKAGEYLGMALKLNPEFKEGKAFYNYLLKLDQTQGSKSKSEKKTGGIFQNIFHSKK